MQIKTIMRCHITPTRMVTVKRHRISSAGKDVEKMGVLTHCGGNTKCCSCCGKQSGSSSKI